MKELSSGLEGSTASSEPGLEGSERDLWMIGSAAALIDACATVVTVDGELVPLSVSKEGDCLVFVC